MQRGRPRIYRLLFPELAVLTDLWCPATLACIPAVIRMWACLLLLVNYLLIFESMLIPVLSPPLSQR